MRRWFGTRAVWIVSNGASNYVKGEGLKVKGTAMAEVTSDMILEILKALQRDSGEVKGNIGDIKAELDAIRGHLISLQQDVHNVYGILGRHDLHLERIERRLELNDAPAA
jgi:hypothetical protein